MKQTRHYCTSCGKKRYEKNLVLVTYHLLRKQAWHCKEHIDESYIATVQDADESILFELSAEADNSKI